MFVYLWMTFHIPAVEKQWFKAQQFTWFHWLIKKQALTFKNTCSYFSYSHSLLQCMDALWTLDVKGYVSLSGIVCDMLMTVAHCLQKKRNYVMEYVEGGDMGTKLDDTEWLSEELTWFYTAKLTLAVEFLHKCGIICRYSTFLVFVCNCHCNNFQQVCVLFILNI